MENTCLGDFSSNISKKDAKEGSIAFIMLK